MKVTPELTTAQKLNLETAKIHWNDLQKFFAQGLMVIVDTRLDLIETAAHFVDDNGKEIERLMSDSLIRKAEMDDAQTWNQQQAEFWAVVTAPWVLVQPIS